MESADAMVASNSTGEWSDITAACRGIAATLSDASPIKHIDGFSLFDAMSAVELMDEKMDPCYGMSGPMILDEILIQAMPENVTPELALETMERLLMCEAAYMNGASMIETFKICIFMWPQMWPKLESYGEVGWILLEFVQLIARSTGLFHSFVMGADIYEEEDFHPGSKPFEVKDFPEDSLKSLQEKISKLAVSFTQNDENTAIFNKMKKLIQLKEVQYRFYQSIDASISQAMEISQKPRSTAEEEKAEIETLRSKKVTNIRDVCARVYASSHELCCVVKEVMQSYQEDLIVSIDLMSTTLVEDTQGLFLPQISRLVSNNPTRKITCPSMVEYLSLLLSICRETASISQIIPGMSSVDTSFDTLLIWCCSVSKAKYHLTSRSLQWGLIHTICSLGGIESLLLASMKASYIPNGYTSAPLCSEWIASFGKVAWESLKIFCMFRYRCLLKLENNILSWSKVSEDAPRVDQIIDSSLYSDISSTSRPSEIYWATKWCLRAMSTLMETHLLLFAELDLLSSFELDSYYFFLEYVTSTKIWVFRKLREMRYKHDSAIHAHAVATAAKLVKDHKKGKGAKLTGKQLKEAKKEMESPPPVVLPILIEESAAIAANLLYKGLVRLIICLLRIGYIRAAPEHEISEKEIRFNSRYSLYRSLSHLVPVSLQDFEKAIGVLDRQHETGQDMLNAAASFFSESKSAFDHLRKVRLTGALALSISKPDVDPGPSYDTLNYTVETDMISKCMVFIKVASNIYHFRMYSNFWFILEWNYPWNFRYATAQGTAR